MPSQGPDLSDPDEWLDDFISGLGDIANLTGGGSFPPGRGPQPVPGLLGSRADLEAIARTATGGADPAALVTAEAAKRIPGAPGSLPYYSVPSPHAGHYATLDEAAKAAASDVPKNPGWEFGAYLPKKYVTDTIDLGDGFGPQSISHVDGYDYRGLYTSENTGKVTLGPVPPYLGAWFHNHPWDFGVNNDDNQKPSPGPDKDEGVIKLIHQTDPLVDTYILGPDGILRKFWRPGDKGEIVK
jgi:hypothetical protein